MKKYLPTSYAAAAVELSKQGFDNADISRVLLHHLKKAKRLSLLPVIAKEIEELQALGDGTVVDVYAAHKLSSAELEQIKKLAKKLYDTDVALRTHEDSALVGGLTLKNGDEVIDYSVATLAENLHSHLTLG